MTPERDIERLLDAWLAEGPQQVSDRAFDDAVARLYRTRQRRAWRLPWRDLTVSTPMRLATAAVAIVAIAAIGYQFLPGSDVGGPTPSPTVTPSPSTTPTPRPTATPCSKTEPTCIGALAPGRHTTGGIITPFSFDVPSGWTKPLDDRGVINLSHEDYPDFVAFIGIWPDWLIASQTSCSRQPEPGLGSTKDDIVNWLVGQPGVIVTGLQDVELGGLSGQVMDIRKNPDVTGACPTDFNMFTHTGTAVDDGGWWFINDDARSRMYFLETGDGHVVNIDIQTESPDDFNAFAELAQPVVDSFDFTP